LEYEELIQLVREFPDRSTKWLLGSPENLRGFLLAVVSDIAQGIDYTRLVKLERTFISEKFRKREADMVFTAPFIDEKDGTTREIIIFLLIEHQASVDPTMTFRVLYYLTQIWNTQRDEFESRELPLHQWRFNPILPVVFYTGSQRWDQLLDMSQLMELPDSMEHYVPKIEIEFFNLKATPPEKLVEWDHPIGWVMRVMQKEDATKEEFKDALKSTIEHLEKLSIEEQANWGKLIYFILAFIHHRRSVAERSELLKTVNTAIADTNRRKESENMVKTIAQALIEEGEETGEKRGEKRGAIGAKQDDLIMILRERFEVTQEDIVKKIRSINRIEELDKLIKRAATSSTFEEVGIRKK